MSEITELDQLDLNKQYTYADYMKWKFDERVELIHGWIKKMSPAPRMLHQLVEGNLYFLIYKFFNQGNCKVFNSPFDVRLQKTNSDHKGITTVIQPDICVVCDNAKLDDAGCLGAPDLIVEILSPSTAQKDRHDKFDLYQENGVKEYWIVEATDQAIEIFTLVKGKYERTDFQEYGEGKVSSTLFPELTIVLSEAFRK